ncbi:MAG: hypothetical protein V4760_04345, partial [Bdellovibrionota bacterium]
MILLVTFAAHEARALCATPVAAAGVMEYDLGTSNIRYCDGTNWKITGGTRLTSCVGTTAGTFYFDPAGPYYKFCDGAYWYRMRGNVVAGGCAGTTDGFMTYDSGVNKMKYCVSNVW